MVKGWHIALSSVAVAGVLAWGMVPAQAADEASYVISVPDGTVAPLVADLAALGEKPDRVFTAAIDGVAATLSEAEVAAIKAEMPEVTVTPDVLLSIAATQTGATWGISSLDQTATPADGSYTYPETSGQGVDVFVIDTGVEAPSLTFPGTLDANRARDFTGYGTWRDCNGHGTHVAGTIGSQTYGVAKRATIIPVRVLDCNGSGSLSSVIAGINYAVTAKTVGKTAVMNLSLGAPGRYSALDDAINNAVDAGIVAAVAAGNSGVDACTSSPAGAAKAFTVGALDNSGVAAYFSNWGSCVEIYGPGVNITSLNQNNQAWTISGTSMAAPHVAGSAALYLGQHPTASVSEVTSAIVAAGTKTCPTCSPNLRVNLQSLVTTESVPGAPGSPVISGVSTSGATVEWTAPASNGGAAIDYYVVDYRLATSTAWTSLNTPGAVTSLSLAGLNPGASYNVRVSAHNMVGTGAASSAASFTLQSGAPAAPGSPTISGLTSSGGTVGWTAPASNGGAAIDYYVVEYKPASDSTWTSRNTAGAVTSLSLTGLTSGTSYNVRVSAHNAAGTGAASATSTFATLSTTPAAPGTPTISGLTSSGGTVGWTAPASNGGAAIDYYIVEYKLASSSIWTSLKTAGPVTSISLAGLNPGASYNVRVSAHNAVGTGAVSATASFTVLSTVPGTPGTPSLSGLTSTAVTVGWTAPASTGGAAIDYYVVEFKLASASTWTSLKTAGPVTSLGLTGLNPATSYNVRVSAHNAVGTGSASTTASFSTRITKPGAPSKPTSQALSATQLSATAATITWGVPGSNGGAAINYYVVDYKLASASTWIKRNTVGPVTSISLTGLNPGSSYNVRVSAVNAAGIGPASEASSFSTLSGVPSEPRNLIVTMVGTTANLSWLAPATTNGAPVTSYVVEYRRTTQSAWNRGPVVSPTGSASPVTRASLSGLAANVAYQFRVTAKTAFGSAVTTTAPTQVSAFKR